MDDLFALKFIFLIEIHKLLAHNSPFPNIYKEYPI